MKKLNGLLLLLLLLCAATAHAQKKGKIGKGKEAKKEKDSPEILSIPFGEIKQGNYTWPDTRLNFEYGKTYVIEVTDINRHLFKIEGTVGQKEFNVNLPTVFGSIKLPSFLTFGLPNPAPSPTTFSLKFDEKKNSDSAVSAFFRYEDPLKLVEDNYKYLQKALRLSTTIKALQMDCGRDYDAIHTALLDSASKALDVSQDSSEQVKALGEGLPKKIEEARVAKGKIEKLQKELLGIIQADIDLAEVGIYNWSLNPTKPESRVYETERDKYTKAQLDKKEGERRMVEANTAVQRALKMIEEMEKLQTENKIQLLLDSYSRINRSNYTYISEPFKIKKDETELKYVFKADTLLTCDYPNRLYLNKEIPTVGGIKVDFSTGVFFNLGGKKFMGQEFYYSQSSTDTTMTFIREKDAGSRLLLSIGAFAHIYKRRAKKVKWALSPGVSTTTAFDSFLFHLGGSAIFGSEDRLVITLGTTLKESSLLDRKFKEDSDYKTKVLPKDVSVIKAFPRFGAFLALTYNLSSLKKPKE
ncbi:hypothetical protein [Persicitalea sp.]|uniref:hypothetical protein n=1 Tax=Persicitalea sp. TaxID=3100273 RepID=UPI003593B2F2